MEALQILLKFALKKDRLHFTQHWMTTEKEMTCDTHMEDGLACLAASPDHSEDRLTELMNAIASDEGDVLPERPQLF